RPVRGRRTQPGRPVLGDGPAVHGQGRARSAQRHRHQRVAPDHDPGQPQSGRMARHRRRPWPGRDLRSPARAHRPARHHQGRRSVMGLFLALVLFAWLIAKAVQDARLDYTYARQGIVSPRLHAKYGRADTAAARVAKYGFFDHLRDAWRDYWPRRTDALIAARNAPSATGGRP